MKNKKKDQSKEKYGQKGKKKYIHIKNKMSTYESEDIYSEDGYQHEANAHDRFRDNFRKEELIQKMLAKYSIAEMEKF